MERLTAREFRFGHIWRLAHKPFAEQVQFLIDVRGADGFIIEALQPLLEAMLPLVEPPPGYLGEMLARSGELRGNGEMLALIGDGRAYVGTPAELLAACRATMVATAEQYAAAGNPAEVRFRAAQELQALQSHRPRLQVVA